MARGKTQPRRLDKPEPLGARPAHQRLEQLVDGADDADINGSPDNLRPTGRPKKCRDEHAAIKGALARFETALITTVSAGDRRCSTNSE